VATATIWNAIFLINLPIGIVAFVLAVVVLRGKTEEHVADANNEIAETQHFDWLGLMLAVASSIALVYSFTQAGTDGWSTATVIGGVLAGGALLVAFVLVELRVADPVMDLRLFRSYTFTIANLLAWVSSAVFFAGLFLVPFFSNGWNIFPLWRRARS
jgi:hypothetical protein